MIPLSCSIVLYKTSEKELRKLLEELSRSSLVKIIYLVDNSPTDELRKFSSFNNVRYLYTNKNLGFGAAHNIALKEVIDHYKYHIVLNSDINFDSGIFASMVSFMEQSEDIGLLSPQILYPDGELQYMCRQMISPYNLFIRRFLPKLLQPLFKNSLDSFLLKHKDYSEIMQVPNLPGCFMFLRTSVLKHTGLFDEKIFMYNEDIDLCRRIHAKYKTVYYPRVSITHNWERGSAKSFKLFKCHLNSTIYYFNKWGWFFDIERREINKSLR